jgi:hypothetical protein
MTTFAQLLTIPVTEEFRINLKTDGSDLPELPVLIMRRPETKEHARIQQRHEKVLLSFDEERSGEYRFNHLGYACDMLKFVTGLEGADEPLDRDVLKHVFERYEKIAIAFSNGIRKALQTLNECDLQQAETLRKN